MRKLSLWAALGVVFLVPAHASFITVSTSVRSSRDVFPGPSVPTCNQSFSASNRTQVAGSTACPSSGGIEVAQASIAGDLLEGSASVFALSSEEPGPILEDASSFLEVSLFGYYSVAGGKTGRLTVTSWDVWNSASEGVSDCLMTIRGVSDTCSDWNTTGAAVPMTFAAGEVFPLSLHVTLTADAGLGNSQQASAGWRLDNLRATAPMGVGAIATPEPATAVSVILGVVILVGVRRR